MKISTDSLEFPQRNFRKSIHLPVSCSVKKQRRGVNAGDKRVRFVSAARFPWSEPAKKENETRRERLPVSTNEKGNSTVTATVPRRFFPSFVCPFGTFPLPPPRPPVELSPSAGKKQTPRCHRTCAKRGLRSALRNSSPRHLRAEFLFRPPFHSAACRNAYLCVRAHVFAGTFRGLIKRRPRMRRSTRLSGTPARRVTLTQRFRAAG